MPERPSSESNLYQISQEKKVLRKQKKSPHESVQSSVRTGLEEIKDELSGVIKEEGGIKPANERLKKDRVSAEAAAAGPAIDEQAILAEMGPSATVYEQISKKSKELDHIDALEMREMLALKIDPIGTKAHERIIAAVRKEKSKLSAELAEFSKNNPTEVRARALVMYKEGLAAEGHIAMVPSVREDLTRIERKILVGKPMFIHGPTGTGKTSLARFSAKRSTGKNTEMVYCTPQTRESQIWGKQALRAEHGVPITVDVYGPLAKAAMEGMPVTFDEFTALPEEQMVFIKGILNAKTGDWINVPGNGRIQIKPGFLMMFTANLKSDKNPARTALPPEIAREFEQNNVEVGYQPANESYDIILTRLMERDGSATLSEMDINETLPALARAMVSIQYAYSGQLLDDEARLVGAMSVANKKSDLKKLVLTQGTVENIIEEWKIEKQQATPLSFVEFIDQRLKTGLTFKEYPKEDRELAAKILAMKGFLRTLTPAELGLDTKIFDFEAARSLRGDPKALADMIKRSRETKRFSLKELADLDPFQTKVAEATARAAGFMPKGAAPESAPPIPEQGEVKEIFGGFLKNAFKESWNANDATTAKAGERPEIKNPEDIAWQDMTVVDSKKFGEFTMNPETTGIDWEHVPPEKIKVFDFKDFVGRKRWELAKYITTEWPDRDKYLIPGIEYWKYVFEHPNEAPDSLKDGNFHYFFGSIFCNSGGGWLVPLTLWNASASGFGRGGDWLDDACYADNRVVLLEK